MVCPTKSEQSIFLLVFFAAGYAKLRNGGLAWMTVANMRSIRSTPAVGTLL
jgi:hypothetical protein